MIEILRGQAQHLNNLVQRYKTCTIIILNGFKITLKNIGKLSFNEEIKRAEEELKRKNK